MAKLLIDIDVDVVISSNDASFAFYAKIHTGRVDGYLDAYMNSSGDFVGKAKLYVDVPWSKSTYTADWNGL